jgi:hypothetical protein
MKATATRERVDEDEHDPLQLSAARFARTPLGRVVLHLECLCHHPAGARFHVHGLMRNLRESIGTMAAAAKRWLRKAGPSAS